MILILAAFLKTNRTEPVYNTEKDINIKYLMVENFLKIF
jgi:hypothetical protein